MGCSRQKSDIDGLFNLGPARIALEMLHTSGSLQVMSFRLRA